MARVLSRSGTASRRAEFACPSCFARPPVGAFWRCGACGSAFDVFDPDSRPTSPLETTTRLDLSPRPPALSDTADAPGECPACHEPTVPRCPRCGAVGLLSDWRAAAALP